MPCATGRNGRKKLLNSADVAMLITKDLPDNLCGEAYSDTFTRPFAVVAYGGCMDELRITRIGL